VENAVFVSKQVKKECITRTLPIGDLAERERILADMISGDLSLAQVLCPGYPYTKADIVYAVRFEMAVTVEDILARRTRLLFLDASAAIKVADEVASLMAKELDKDSEWKKEQVTGFIKLAQQYLLA
jgi:glycerol-3-phosphate dehydrogenase